MKSANGCSGGKIAGGVAFSEAEECTVRKINALAKGVHDANRLIGKFVDALVQEKGGTTYGEGTLKRLAKHPSLMCSYEHMRQCWWYYRLTARYATGISRVAPSLSYSHQYQLSRLLVIENEDDQGKTVLAMAKKASEEGMTNTELADCVSSHLASIGKAIKGKPGTSKESKQAPEVDAYDMIIDMSNTVFTATERLKDKPDIGRVADMKLAANRIGYAYVQLVKKLVGVGDEDAARDARKVGIALAAAVELKTTTEGGEPQ